MTAPPLARKLAGHVRGLSFDGLPPEVVAKTKRVVLHDLAVAFGGHATEQGERAREFARSGGDGGASTIIGQPSGAQPIDAAFVNTVYMRALRMEDSILPSFVHPGAMLIPAALAVGEQEGSPGREVVAALVAGYDVVGSVAGSLWTWVRGGRTASHVFGAFGVAAVAARLMKLDEEQTATALAYAGNLAAMITYGFEDFQYGLVTRNGITAALLGRCRGPSPPDALEGRYGFYAAQTGGPPDGVHERVNRLGTVFEIMTAVTKPHPCTALNLVPLQLLKALLHQHDLRATEMAAIRVRRAKEAGYTPNIHHYGPFDHMYVATSSLPFAIATTLVDGAVTPERFRAPNDAEVLRVARLVEIEAVEGWDLLTHEVEITTRDGRTVAGRGAGELLPEPDAAAILERYGVPVVGREKVGELRRQVAELETLASISNMTACLA